MDNLTKMNSKSFSNYFVFILVLLVLTVFTQTACDNNSNTPGKVSLVDYNTLPAAMRVNKLGYIGYVYQLTGSENSEARFLLPDEVKKILLVNTIRLFKYDTKNKTWYEIADSQYEKSSNSLLAKNLQSGYYTGFGWSTNPVGNTLQRLALDLSHGYQPPVIDNPPINEDKPEQRLNDRFRENLVVNWFEATFRLYTRICYTLNNPGCDNRCARYDSPRGSCPAECPISQPLDSGGTIACCECNNEGILERIRVPESIFDSSIAPCRGSDCPVCPDGLTCRNGKYATLDIIQPFDTVPDYTVLHDLRLGSILKDTLLRESMHSWVEGVLNKEYPIPPPWPN